MAKFNDVVIKDVMISDELAEAAVEALIRFVKSDGDESTLADAINVLDNEDLIGETELESYWNM